MDRQSRFSVGDRVQVRSDRSRVGEVLRPPVAAGGEYWYVIRFLDGSRDKHVEADLEAFTTHTSAEELFARRSFGDQEDLLRLVTFQKLDSPVDNTIYAAYASRTDFHPHQYKPLIKFIDSQHQRLLIADEVGLGKTIEAGLIMIEMRARGALDHALVVCPSVLRDKWREEMWRRFDEEFTILDSTGIRSLISTFEERGRLTHGRVIVSLETIRQRGILRLLEASPLMWDVVVFDEAHHLRNTEAQTHKASAALCEGAAAVLMLTATPIQLGNENLFNLLRLLAPDEFADYFAFQEQLEANAPVVEAQRILGGAFPPAVSAVAERLERLRSGGGARFFANSPLLERVIAVAESGSLPTREQVARMAEDLKDLNLLGHIFTRTRKREVMISSAVRDPRVVRREMTAAERRFYDAVTNFVRHQAGDNLYFGAVTAQRQVASSMQAARRTFVSRALDYVVDDGDALDLGFFEELGTGPQDVSAEVLEAAAALESTDTKFDALIHALTELETAEPGRQIILFSFFRATLEYLEVRLRDAGFTCGVIHGGVKSDPTGREDLRGQRIKAFRNGEFQILLSSEVGSEGLDFQFCHIMINYDLPWNPMRVEQRIGRLDRLGQESAKIIILTLSLSGTIEDRILSRLYERIGVFRRSLGDLEAILGEEVQELARDLLSRQLTPEQEEARIDRAAAVLEQRIVDIEKLEQESGRFLGTDQYFEEQLERARTGGEILAPKDLEAYVSRFLEREFPKSRLVPERHGGFHLEVDSSLEMAIRKLPDDIRRLRLLHRIASGRGQVRIAFDPDDARDDDQIELVVGLHPLIRLTTQHFREHPEQLHPVSALTVTTGAEMPEGVYAYAIEEIAIKAARDIRRMEPFFVNVASQDVLDEASCSRLFGLMLRNATVWSTVPEFDADSGLKLMEQVDVLFVQRLAARRQAAKERATSLTRSRIASLEISHQNRVRRIQERLSRAAEDQVAYRRMMEGQLRAAQARFAEKVNEVEREADVVMKARLVGCGLVNVMRSVQ